MAPSDKENPNDLLLTQYLLGVLPDEEAEHLDQLSVTDEAFAWRLTSVENDLVDAYVRGELSGRDSEQFEKFYLSSPVRRDKVQLARGLATLESRGAAVPAQGKAEAVRIPGPEQRPSARSARRMPAVSPVVPPWGFAAASIVLLILGGYLLIQNLQLQKQIRQVQSEHGAAGQRAQDLENQLAQERAAKDQALKDLKQATESKTDLDQLKTVSVLLPPPLRGTGPIPAISLRSGPDLVVLVLPLEAGDFPAYQAKLSDPVAGRVLWTSAKLTATAAAERKTVSISFRAHILRQQNYIVDLAGIPKQGAPEPIGGYPFRVVLK